MTIINLNPNFSTSSRVTLKKPHIKNNPSSKVKNLLFLPPNLNRQGEGGLRTQGYFKCNQHNRNFKNSEPNSFNLPLVTIITVVFNGEKYLEQTIQSVINQTYNNIEYIIIDGGSRDSTIDIIYQYDNFVDYWVSEPDDGLYHAMNKGIQLATGEIIGIINSDDWYPKDAIYKVVERYISCQTDKTIIWGSMYRTHINGNIKFKINKSKNYLAKKINLTNPVNHPATFVAKNVYATIGMFNKQYKICGDYDFIYRAYYSQTIEFLVIDDCLAYMRLDGISEQSNFKTIWTMAEEGYKIRKSNTFFLKNIMIFIYSLIRSIFKRQTKYLVSDSLLSLYYRYRHDTN